MGPEKWNDDRLDDLSRRVGRVEPVVTDVAVLKRDMENLTTAIRTNTTATQNVAEQLEKAQMEPVTRARNLRNALIVAVASALVGGGLAILGAAIASGH